MKRTLEESILATICYYDLFSYPLTEREVWVNLFTYQGDSTYGEYLFAIERLVHEGRLQCTEGVLHRPGRAEICEIRRERYGIAERKFARALWFTRLIARVPFVRMVAVCNTLAFSNSADESDIDFFIVVKSGWIWCVRGITTGLAAVLGVRPHQRGLTRDTMCLSFFASDAALCLESLALPIERGLPDVYLCSWVRHLIPLYDEGGIADRFQKANIWVNSYHPHPFGYAPNARRVVHISRIARALKAATEFLCRMRILEDSARSLQLRLLPRSLGDTVHIDTGVVLTDSILKFHQHDRRKEIREQFRESLKACASKDV